MPNITRTIRSDWYSGVERQYDVTVDVSLDWHTQKIDSFDEVSKVRLAGQIIPLEILNRLFLESLRRSVQELVCPNGFFA